MSGLTLIISYKYVCATGPPVPFSSRAPPESYRGTPKATYPLQSDTETPFRKAAVYSTAGVAILCFSGSLLRVLVSLSGAFRHGGYHNKSTWTGRQRRKVCEVA